MINIDNFSLNPTFRDNATLVVNKIEYKDQLETNSSILVYCSSPVKKYSFGVALDDIIVEEGSKLRLDVDKDLVGPLVQGDLVSIVPFDVPLAEKVIFLLPNSMRVPEGDWGDLLKEQFSNEVVDNGSEYIFTYPSKLNPLLVNAVVETTIPLAPSRLHENTRVFVKKLDNMEIEELKSKSQVKKVERVDEYLKQLEDVSFDLVRAIKSDKAKRAADSFDFRATPKNIFDGISVIFQQWKSLRITKNESEDDLIAGMDYVLKSKEKALALTEVKIFAKKDQGKLSIITYTPSDSNPRIYLDEIVEKIHSLTIGVSTTPKIVTENCPGCGAPYDPRDADPKGLLNCASCGLLIENDLKYRVY
ncbi:MAG: hypothetical protein ACXAD7_10460 [Candidatus Kariarchaeaceae archaeon]|jgi:hypothetical protein